LAPKLCLARKKRAGRRANAKHKLQQQLDAGGVRAAAWEIEQHREDLEEQHHQAALVDEIGESASQLGENENDELTQRVRRAVELANNNHLSRATQALIQPSLAPSSPSTVAQLRSLHPPSSASFSAPPVPAGARTFLMLEEDRVLSIIKQLRNGAAPGPCCWTAELLSLLWLDEDCRKGLIAIITDLLNGNIDDSVRSLLLSSCLIPVKKDAAQSSSSSSSSLVAESSSAASSSAVAASPCGVGVGVGGAAPSSHHSASLSTSSSFSSSSLSSSSRSAERASDSASVPASNSSSNRLLPETDSNSKVRPIAVGDVLYKIAAKYAISELSSSDLNLLFPSIQVGVGVRGGAERAVHLVQSWLETGPDDSVLIMLDFSNAFNSCSRQKMLETFLSHNVLQPCWRLFHWAYREPSPLLLYDKDTLEHVISSSEGGRQGDPLMPLAFSALVQPLYSSVSGPGLNAVADLDDLSIVAPQSLAFGALQKVLSSAAQYQLHPNLSKTRLFSLHPTPQLREACAQQHIKMEEGEIAEWLGAVVGKVDGEEAKQWCVAEVEKLRPLFKQALLHSAMPNIIALSIARLCLLPKINFLSRVLPPSATAPALLLLDSMASEFFVEKFQCPPLSEAAKLQLSCPVSHIGGFGFVSNDRLAPAAYLSSLSLAMPAFSALFALRPNSPVFARFKNCLDFLFSHGISHGDQHLPSTVSECVALFGKVDAPHFQLQHYLSQHLHKFAVRDFLSNSDLEPAALKSIEYRLLSSASHHASAWLLNPQNDLSKANLQLSNEEIRRAALIRIGAPFCDPQVKCPRCKERVIADGDTFSHLCNCPVIKKSVIDRHDLIVRAFEDVVHQSRLFSEHEPRDRQPQDHCAPDGLIHGLRARVVAFDVSVAHPGRSFLSSMPLLAQTELKAAADREAEKKHKFQAKLNAADIDFVPIVLETYGAIGKEAQNMISELAALIEDSGRQPFKDWAYSHLSRALQKGNALVWGAGLRLVAGAAAEP